MAPPKKQLPHAYRRYLLLRGQKHGLPKLQQTSYAKLKQLQHPDLAAYMEHPPTQQAPLLFYPGCYIYSPQTIRNTLKILDHLGTPYQVLGGLTYCCGLPHRFQGNTTDAKTCTDRLKNAINTVNPQIIITSCLECLEALNAIKQEDNAPYTVQHVLEYMNHHRTQLPKIKNPGRLIIHEPCRLAAFPTVKTATENLITSLGAKIQYLPDTIPHCCRHWHHGDPKNQAAHTKIIDATRHAHARLVCPCLTAQEDFQKTDPTAPLTDLIDLYANALPTRRLNK